MTYHIPALGAEVLELGARATRVADCTLGDGGHAQLFLERGATLLGIDQDPIAIRRAIERLEPWGDRLTTLHGNAFDAPVIDQIRRFQPDFVLLDLGVSSRQLDDEALGFSFRPGVPLDMRMTGSGPTAADLLATSSQEQLADWLFDYGDERKARRLAAEIVKRRPNHAFRVSDDLVNAIRAALGPRAGPADFARIFQAIRIAVNHELDRLENALPLLRDALVPTGLLAVISYHSGEDRRIKHAFRQWASACICPPRQPICTCRGRPLGRVVTASPIQASEEEQLANPRSRSAKLRVFEVFDETAAAR